MSSDYVISAYVLYVLFINLEVADKKSETILPPGWSRELLVCFYMTEFDLTIHELTKLGRSSRTIMYLLL
jgi:hypothetical protein